MRITALETVAPARLMPGLMMLRVHTDGLDNDRQSILGHGETYYLSSATAAVVHDWMAQRLLGADPLAIESHWRFLYERSNAFGGVGAELRALSAIDLALWDILGQALDQPIWKLLGGAVRESIPVYNSCGGPFYGSRNSAATAARLTEGWPGHGDPGKPGALEDNWASMNTPGELAQELLEEGFRAMKLWAFDAVYRRSGGQRLSAEDVREGAAPFYAIREQVGDRIELMLDGHGFFALPAALRIDRALQDARLLWMEDVMRIDNLKSLAQFRRDAQTPVAVSEMLVTREQYRQALELEAADYVMIDPTWVGGISESRRIAELAQLYNVPVLMHDCTGPFTLLAGLQIAASVPGVTYQECVRAHIATLYPHMLDENVALRGGAISLPQRAGIGARWQGTLFDESDPTYRITRL